MLKFRGLLLAVSLLSYSNKVDKILKSANLNTCHWNSVFWHEKKKKFQVFSKSSLRIYCNAHSGRMSNGWADTTSLWSMQLACHLIPNTSSSLSSGLSLLASVCVHHWCFKAAIHLGYISSSLSDRLHWKGGSDLFGTCKKLCKICH